MVVADLNANVLDTASWKQDPAPIFQRSNANDVYGPGHHSFFKSPDGKEDWILYHGKTSSAYTYDGRSTRAQKFTWKADGTPDLGAPLPLSADIPVPFGDGTYGTEGIYGSIGATALRFAPGGSPRSANARIRDPDPMPGCGSMPKDGCMPGRRRRMPTPLGWRPSP